VVFFFKTKPNFIGPSKTEPKRRKKKAVTIIIGAICKRGIVIASDSQSTGEDRIKHCNTQKVFKIELADKSSALVAGAGSTDLAAETIKAMARIAKGKRLNDYRALGDIAAQACRETRENQERWFCGTSAELKQHLSDNPFYLMIANYFKKEPFVFMLTSQKGSVVWPRSQSHFILGNSPVAAEYILRKFSFPQMDIIEAMLAVVYSVNEIINMDSTCSPPIQVGTLEHSGSGSLRFPASRARLWSPGWIESIRKEFDERSDEMNTHIAEQMKSTFLAVAKHILPSGELNPDYEVKVLASDRRNALIQAMKDIKK
jgi:20S proteasome alpha/beta subunit